MKSSIQHFEKNNSKALAEKVVFFFTIIALFFTMAVLTVSCKPNANEAGVAGDPKQASIDSMQVVIDKQNAQIAKQKTIDSMQAIVDREKQQARHSRQVANQTAAAAPAEKRKGWSRAAKGAVIGAGVGAVAGSVINKKNHTEGAIIGGLAGAGVGAGTGAIIDTEKAKKGK